MDPSYPFPPDDYALNILTQVAMHKTDAHAQPYAQSSSSSSQMHGMRAPPTAEEAIHLTSYQQSPASTSAGPRESSTKAITNHHDQRDPKLRRRPGSNATLSRMSDSLGDYNPAALSTRSMETLVFNPESQGVTGRQNPYMNHVFHGGGSHISNDYAGPLGILNAESYDDGRGALRAQEESENRMKHQARMIPFGLTGEQQELSAAKDFNAEGEDAAGTSRRRKKPRIEANSADEDEDAGKKARGRPRVDTKDETAADRRRTQIRMAQRAYRHRKETTISSLEKQVQDLQGNNEEMSNIFISLYDYAVGQGLLQREPDFGQQLQSTTKRFLALAKATTNDDSNHEEIHAEESDKQNAVEPESGRRQRGRKPSPKKQQQVTPPDSEPAQPWGGYSLARDESPVEELPVEYPQVYENRGRSGGLQVITRPTEENASFPFEFMNLQQYRVELPSIEDFSQSFLPQSQPPLPATLTYSEFSFARRLHRITTERGLKLLTMENPPKGRLHRIFGICLTYNTKEQIIQRLKDTIAATNKDTLHQWREPFVNIGGAGTFYPMYDTEMDGALMPKFRTGLSMGPFSSPVSAARETMQDDLRCTLPGFEGDYFDVNDVEGYLRGQGIDIPTGADYVTAELDLGSLTGGASPGSITSMASTASPRTPRSPIEGLLINRMKESAGSLDMQQFGGPAKTFAFDYSNWNLTPPEHDTSNMDLVFDTMMDQDDRKEVAERSPSINYSAKRTVTLNVEILVKELIDRVICLGRSPGFRLADINVAIIAAVEAGFSS